MGHHKQSISAVRVVYSDAIESIRRMPSRHLSTDTGIGKSSLTPYFGFSSVQYHPGSVGDSVVHWWSGIVGLLTRRQPTPLLPVEGVKVVFGVAALNSGFPVAAASSPPPDRDAHDVGNGDGRYLPISHRPLPPDTSHQGPSACPLHGAPIVGGSPPFSFATPRPGSCCLPHTTGQPGPRSRSS